MTGFGDDMKAQLEEFRKAKSAEEEAGKPKPKSEIKYEVEASGIDLVVSRIAGGRTTMKLFIYLSQPDESGRGTMFIKTMKDGSMKPATVDSIASFLGGLKHRQLPTDSEAIPVLAGGKEFAGALIQAAEPRMTELIKEGLLNTEMLRGKDCGRPWYAASGYNYNKRGVGIEDRHAKLIRHMVSSIAERSGARYSSVLVDACRGDSWRSDPAPGKTGCIWAFSILADVFDEPYAQRCFDEYIDNDRLNSLGYWNLYWLFDRIAGHMMHGTSDWADDVRIFRAGKAIVNLEKNRFWEFLQHAVAVGMGSRLDKYIDLYKDYLTQAFDCDGKVRDKYPEHLQEAHDIYAEKIALIERFREQKGLEEAVAAGKELVDMSRNGYELRMLTTVNAFLEEARQNCNCVASYVSRVAAGRCWIASFRPEGGAATQLTVEILPNTGEMMQIMGKYNRDPTAKELAELAPFQEELCKRVAAKEAGHA